ncbi:MAG TPA: putative urea ABC transporter substrate-binding protein [Xanthobacteraceae bacterium]|nr:putative urea ABC transporter substrate-binding protein [Xanthobacteraceae bacterium]
MFSFPTLRPRSSRTAAAALRTPVQHPPRQTWLRGATAGAAALIALACAGPLAATPAQAAPKTTFDIAWTIYVGWMPWAYAAETGIVKKWADKYGLTINVTQINDYVESINQYTAGKFDGVTLTNMDALTIPAAGGVDTTALIIGDFSNGNDGIVSKTAKTPAYLKGESINLVELSVSHYLLARALASAGLSEKDVKVVNTSDADMVAAFKSADVKTVVTWNPLLAEVEAEPGVARVFNSSQIPGEIIDMLGVNSEVLKDNPNFGKALVGIWYETLALVADQGAAGKATREALGKLSGTDLAGYDAQLAATKLFVTPKEAVAFTESQDLIKTMELVRSFSFEHGLLGDGAKSPDAVGMAFAGGKTLGDAANIKLRFDPTYMKLAADGKL